MTSTETATCGKFKFIFLYFSAVLSQYAFNTIS